MSSSAGVAVSVAEELDSSHAAYETQDHVLHATESRPGNAGEPGIEEMEISTEALANDVVPVRSKLRLFTVIVALFSCLFISALNQTIVATATPTICEELQSAAGYSWIAGAYLLATAASVPIWAKMSDIWGRKPILLIALVLYMGGSIISALATDMDMLIVGRAVQGTAGGGMYQLVNITVSDLFSLRRRTLMLSLFECVWFVAGGVGPVLGGVFTEYVTWRWIFWINLPISGVSWLLLFVFLDVHNPRTKMLEGLKAVDWFGCVSILGLIVLVLLGLDFGGVTFPWNSTTVICLLIFGVLMSPIFIYAEAKVARYPLMPMNLFRNRSNIGCLVVAFFQDFVAASVEFYMPLYFQSVMAASPSRSGLYIIPSIVTQSLVGILGGIFMHRSGRFVELIRAGTVLMTLGAGLFIDLDASASLGKVIGFIVLWSVGSGALWEPPLIALQASVRPAQMSTATATMGFARMLATAVSVVIGGVVFQNTMQDQAPSIRAAGLPANVTSLLSGSEAAAHVDLVGQITDPHQRFVVESAYAASLKNVWILCTAMSAVAIVGGLMIAHGELSKEHVETRTGLEEEEKNRDKSDRV